MPALSAWQSSREESTLSLVECCPEVRDGDNCCSVPSASLPSPSSSWRGRGGWRRVLRGSLAHANSFCHSSARLGPRGVGGTRREGARPGEVAPGARALTCELCAL